MCRFKIFWHIIAHGGNLFQYIICVGSSNQQGNPQQLPLRFQYIICVGSRDGIVLNEALYELFQYIICVGSRLTSLADCLFVIGFNTSYVSVQVLPSVIVKLCCESFQYIICVGSRYFKKHFVAREARFNTSYVSVQDLKLA